MVLKKVFLIMFLTGSAFGDTGFTSTIRVSETDNSPACTVGQIKVSTGTLTCQGQVGIIATGGSGGGSFTACGSNPAGLQFTDSASCTWCTTVATTGNLVTTLQSCPTPQIYKPCFQGEPIGLLLALTCNSGVYR